MKMKMLGRVTAFAVLAVMLSGCSTWENTMYGLGLYGPEDVPADSTADTAMSAPAAQPRAQMPPAVHKTRQASNWCHQVAEQDRDTAAENGFDLATQQRRYSVSYRQCIAVQDDAGQ
jgi:predicted small secreted protein